ncbi:MAG: tetratricopeptide repeat protein [Balneolaceae bacterium]|nr:tetratricopeptide repeat protein [Balneolaceae bacterium]
MKSRILARVLAVLLTASVNAQNFDAGVQLFERGELDKAEDVFQSLKKSQPKNPQVYFYLGRIEFNKDEYKDAGKWFEEAADLDEDNSLYWMWMGHSFGRQAQNASVLRQAGLARNSRKNYEKAIELDPNNVEARESAMEFYLQAPGFLGGGRDKAELQASTIEKLDTEAGIKAWGRIYTYYDETQFAEVHYKTAIENHPEIMVSYFELFNFYFNEQEFEKAADLAIQQLQVNDTTAAIYNNLGNAQQRYGLYDQALENYQKALEIDPDFSNSWYQIGRMAAVSGMHLETGMEHIEKYISLGDELGSVNLAWALYRKGSIFEHMNQKAKAKEFYQQALQVDGDHEEAKKALAALN